MSEDIVKFEVDSAIVESLVLQGDISKMQPQQKVEYYNWLCRSLGLNPATQPFQIIKFQGREQLYAKKDATEQLRKIYGVSVTELEKTFREDLYIVTAKVQDRNGRTDAATGAVVIKNVSGESLANAIMKAETKAKRRATLSICGLGMLDESETDTIGKFETVDIKTGEIKITETPEKRSTRNFTEETKDIETKEQFEAWTATLIAEEDKKDAKGIKEAVANRLFKANLDKVIANIKSNTPDKTLYAVESELDNMEEGSKRDDLIRAYNEMCEKRGLDHKYEPLPFDR